ncbi:SGNH/GDSL hydrolase family protein [Lapidilactobacillus bayanensis]|uniref:SGNH/GDSL hydrolase family protein n=1 Tax=Lapidilactobacillus bayanensis TaxID=2485998 RepID=UPI000F7AD747|nr:SGNH/GDSL hydrolase family protein [Lapidilactobacillus bayanensis]
MSHDNLAALPGNAVKYAPKNAVHLPNSPLANQHVAFLGSSITLGAGSLDQSFVDYLVSQDNLIAVKSAVNGTTLAGKSTNGYLTRLQDEIPQNVNYDAFVCQLSTNDTRHDKQLGQISAGNQLTDFDVETTTGALELILAYVQQHWHCPVLFYTCLRTDKDTDYQLLIQQLYELTDKWDFEILDLNHDTEVQQETTAHPAAMLDDAHPTQLGYRDIWTPRFRKILTEMIATKN